MVSRKPAPLANNIKTTNGTKDGRGNLKIENGFSLHHAWRQFCQEVSVVGLKYAANPEYFSFRRFIWIILVICGVVFAIYQIGEQMMIYLKYPTNIDMQVNTNETLQFPTVTICNENGANLSKVESFDPNVAAAFRILYPPVAVPYLVNFSAGFDLLIPYQDSNWTLLLSDFMLDPVSQVKSCTFNGAPCNTSLFKQVVTSMGRCLQINQDSTMTVSQPGVSMGLRLFLYTDQNNYLMAFSPSAGYRVYLHDSTEPADVLEWGFKANINQHTMVQMTTTRVCARMLNIVCYDRMWVPPW